MSGQKSSQSMTVSNRSRMLTEAIWSHHGFLPRREINTSSLLRQSSRGTVSSFLVVGNFPEYRSDVRPLEGSRGG